MIICLNVFGVFFVQYDIFHFMLIMKMTID